MKIVVIGGTGLIGSKAITILRQGDREILAASPNSGVNTITGEGVKERGRRAGGDRPRQFALKGGAGILRDLRPKPGNSHRSPIGLSE